MLHLLLVNKLVNRHWSCDIRSELMKLLVELMDSSRRLLMMRMLEKQIFCLTACEEYLNCFQNVAPSFAQHHVNFAPRLGRKHSEKRVHCGGRWTLTLTTGVQILTIFLRRWSY